MITKHGSTVDPRQVSPTLAWEPNTKSSSEGRAGGKMALAGVWDTHSWHVLGLGTSCQEFTRCRNLRTDEACWTGGGTTRGLLARKGVGELAVGARWPPRGSSCMCYSDWSTRHSGLSAIQLLGFYIKRLICISLVMDEVTPFHEFPSANLFGQVFKPFAHFFKLSCLVSHCILRTSYVF